MPIKALIVGDETSLLYQAKIFLERLEEEIDVSSVSSAEKALDAIDEMSEIIKETTKMYGASLVGVIELNKDWLYSHDYEGE